MVIFALNYCGDSKKGQVFSYLPFLFLSNKIALQSSFAQFAIFLYQLTLGFRMKDFFQKNGGLSLNLLDFHKHQ